MGGDALRELARTEWLTKIKFNYLQLLYDRAKSKEIIAVGYNS